MSQGVSAAVLFVALEPDAALGAIVSYHKHRVRELVGPQLYLADPPHLTIYLAAFRDEAIARRHYAELAGRLMGFEFEVTGWLVFASDPLTGNHTLVCEMAAHDKERLRVLQYEVIAELAPLRDPIATSARLTDRWHLLSEQRQKQVERVGFPYVGEDWQPHWTIASIRPGEWDRVWNDLGPRGPSGRYGWSRLRLYRLEGERPVPVD